MYTEVSYDLGDSIEHEAYYAGKYGAKGEKRAPKRKPTQEQIRKQNQINKTNMVRRLLKLNYEAGDLWTTLKYPRGHRPTMEEVKKNMKSFTDKCRTEYKKRGYPFKFVRRAEIGKRGGVHIHIVINRIPDSDKIVRDAWKWGRPNFTPIDGEEDSWVRLAEYISKEPEEQIEQLSLFGLEEQKVLTSYSCSRNLIRPVPKKKTYSHWTMRRILRDGPKPKEGFCIIEDSIRSGINRFTGMSWYKYTEVRVMRRQI